MRRFKRYKNRKLYDMDECRTTNFGKLLMILDKHDVIIVDEKGEDITREVLSNIPSKIWTFYTTEQLQKFLRRRRRKPCSASGT